MKITRVEKVEGSRRKHKQSNKQVVVLGGGVEAFFLQLKKTASVRTVSSSVVYLYH